MPVDDFYATGVYVFTNDLLPWPEGKIPAVGSLEVAELDQSYRRVRVANYRASAGNDRRFSFRIGSSRWKNRYHHQRNRNNDDYCTGRKKPVFLPGIRVLIFSRLITPSLLSRGKMVAHWKPLL